MYFSTSSDSRDGSLNQVGCLRLRVRLVSQPVTCSNSRAVWKQTLIDPSDTPIIKHVSAPQLCTVPEPGRTCIACHTTVDDVEPLMLDPFCTHQLRGQGVWRTTQIVTDQCLAKPDDPRSLYCDLVTRFIVVRFRLSDIPWLGWNAPWQRFQHLLDPRQSATSRQILPSRSKRAGRERCPESSKIPSLLKEKPWALRQCINLTEKV